ncbi:MAG TPA: bacillithiol biosynthesis cysteine-adding enzyme BshC [Vicinamibacterales bacterium]|nr:bacillithiol biosynthesis cysteine-adding enzyme BshC [Vicinamibacterales bacterium]
MDFRDLSAGELPHTSKLVRDFLGNFTRLKSFYERQPDFKSVTKYARKLEFPGDRRRQVADVLRAQNVLFGSSPETVKNIDRLARGAVAMVSGQQVGLFGGPAYSFYKALTAIQAAESLTSEGIPAVPVFWMATEDHDVDEVRHVTWFHEGQLLRLELPKPAQEAIPVGRVRLGPEIDELVSRAQALLGETFGNYLHETYVPEATYGSAFAGLFARIFADFGLILLDPLDERLHQIAAPVLREALACRDELNDELLRRGKALEHAGYDPQVKVTSRSTLLFSLANGKREVITASNGTFACGNLSLPREQWLELVEAEPENFSPNALLRSVLQDFLLPTVAYFGGPSEIAYFAQSQILYEKLLKRMPVLLPRADFTLVDPKAERLLRKYHLNAEDVWSGSESLRKAMYNSVVPQKLSREFDDSLRVIDKRLKKLHKAIAKVDPTIQGTIARAGKRIGYQIEKLRHKTGAALDRHEKQIEQHQKFLENLLYPQKGLQSRDLCFLPFLARWGSGGLYELQKLAAPKRLGRHMIVPIP